MSVYDKLKELGIALPPVATPAAAYVPFVQTGNLVFLSGHIAKKEGKAWVGQLGKNMTTEDAKTSLLEVLDLDTRALGKRKGIYAILVGSILGDLRAQPDDWFQSLMENDYLAGQF